MRLRPCSVSSPCDSAGRRRRRPGQGLRQEDVRVAQEAGRHQDQDVRAGTARQGTLGAVAHWRPPLLAVVKIMKIRKMAAFRAAEKRYKRYNDGRVDADLSSVLDVPAEAGRFQQLAGRAPGVSVCRCASLWPKPPGRDCTRQGAGCRWSSRWSSWRLRCCSFAAEPTTTCTATWARVHSWRYRSVHILALTQRALQPETGHMSTLRWTTLVGVCARVLCGPASDRHRTTGAPLRLDAAHL